MIVLAGGDLVLPDRILTNASLFIEGDRIAAIEPRARVDTAAATIVDIRDHYVVPGFVDVHVHGVLGHDTLDGGDTLASIAASLPRYGVTAFCPTTVACSPADLSRVLRSVRDARVTRPAASARVLPAHLESNFINPEYRGAQPLNCIRRPPATARAELFGRSTSGDLPGRSEGDFAGADILDVITTYRADVGIVTLAPEMPGGLDLVARLVAAGHRVSLGHTGATFEEANDAIDAGIRHATHLFNRMSPLAHRAPGATGAALAREEVAAELICDGVHVHPAVCRVAIATKGVGGIMAITDATAGAGLAAGSHARLGGQRITVRDGAAFLDEGTIAGSTLTMDRAFRTIATQFGSSIVDAAQLCATTPARALGLTGFGVIATGTIADIVVLDRGFQVARTIVAGHEVWRRER
jgi:N-acetylglucosamine-6-phosphate deacetylase